MSLERMAYDSLLAKVAALEADAARYRHIRKGQGHYGFEVIKRDGMFQDKRLTGKKLDAAIDAAMGSE